VGIHGNISKRKQSLPTFLKNRTNFADYSTKRAIFAQQKFSIKILISIFKKTTNKKYDKFTS